MEAAGRSAGAPAQLPSDPRSGAARSRAFWIVAGLTAARRRPALRHPRRPGLPPRRDRHRQPRPARSASAHAMDAVGFSESAPPLYYALAWLWTQVAGTGEFGLRSLSAAGRGRDGPGRLPARRASCAAAAPAIFAAALVAVNPMLLWYSQEARAYALLGLFCAALAALLRPGAASAAARRDFVLLGRLLGARPGDPLLRRLPARRRGVLLLRAAAAARSAAGLWIVGLAGARCWRRWRSTRCPTGTPNGSASSASATGSGRPAITFTVGETGDIIGRPEQPAAGAGARWRWSLAAFAPALARGSARRAARRRRPAGGRRRPPSAIPLLLALRRRRQGLRPRPQPAAGAGPAAGRGRGRRSPCAAPAALGTAVAALLVAYSLGFCDLGQHLARPAAARLGGGRRAPRRTGRAAGDGHLDPRRGAAALLPLDRGDPAKPSEGYDWLVHEIDFVSDGRGAAAAARGCSARGFREAGYEDGRPALHPPLRAAGPGAGAAAAAQSLRDARTRTSATTGSSSTGRPGLTAARVSGCRGLSW